jgi:AraC-like DNA-binding protein
LTTQTRFWRPPALGGAELAFASYGRHAFPRHFHEEYTIAIMVRGVERLQHAVGTEMAPAGSLILLNPAEVHQNSSVDDTGFAYRTLYLPLPLAERCLLDAGFVAGPLPGFTKMVAFDRCAFNGLRRLHEAVEAGEPLLRLQDLLSAALLRLFQRHTCAPPPRPLPRPPRSRMERVRDYLDAHFAENVSLNDLGRLVSLSTFHLANSFRAEFGMPPGQYQIHCRVIHAARKLRQGTSIAEAAFEAAFSDQSHLTRHFKRILGVTPGQFQTDRKIVQD